MSLAAPHRVPKAIRVDCERASRRDQPAVLAVTFRHLWEMLDADDSSD